jgi:N-acetylated-alpha-linked acidic dipeptidase
MERRLRLPWTSQDVTERPLRKAFPVCHIVTSYLKADCRLFLSSVPDAEIALATSRKYATIPHLAGSLEDYDSAKTMLELFQAEFNIDIPSELPVFSAGTLESRNATLGITSSKTPTAWIDAYYPVLNAPLATSLQILGDDGNPVWSADLVEQGDERDPEAAKYADAVPTFHGYSKSGEVEGQLIYANYGNKEDFDKLTAAGVNFTGKIVITRYGTNVRGLKVYHSIAFQPQAMI